MKQYFKYQAKRDALGGVFKIFAPWRPGQVIEVDNYDDVKLIEFEPFTNHKHSLDMLAGV